MCQLGYCTLYTFYAYPDKKRYRLSQILILPPYQRKGTAASLLKAVYRLAEQNNAVDITVRCLHGFVASRLLCRLEFQQHARCII